MFNPVPPGADQPPLQRVEPEQARDPETNLPSWRQPASPWRTFLGGMALLTLGVPLWSVALWMLWGTLFAPAGDQVYGPGSAAFDRRSRTEIAELVLELHNHGLQRELRKEDKDSEPDRVADVLRVVRQDQRDRFWAGTGVNPRAIDGMRELERRQAAEVREWRVKQGCLLAVPALLIGGGVTWLGLGLVRRAKLPGTVFSSEDEKADKKLA